MTAVTNTLLRSTLALCSFLVWIAPASSFCFRPNQQCTTSTIRYTTNKNGSSTSSLAAKAWKKMQVSANQLLPELLVFDLDSTLWTPELYQLDQKKRTAPRARKDIHLFPDIHLILKTILKEEEEAPGGGGNNPGSSGSSDTSIRQQPQPKWAVASRAQNKDWALELLSEFRVDYQNKKDVRTLIPDVFDDLDTIVIQGGTKKRHFQALRERTNIPYHKMLFYDDWDVNLQEVAQLGVLSCHCPEGLTLDIFRTSLQKYHELKEGETVAGDDDDNDGDYNWMGYVI